MKFKRGDRIVTTEAIQLTNVDLHDFIVLSPLVEVGIAGVICAHFHRRNRFPLADQVPVAFELHVPSFGSLILRAYVSEKKLKPAPIE